jgi:hypothetical protein
MKNNYVLPKQKFIILISLLFSIFAHSQCTIQYITTSPTFINVVSTPLAQSFVAECTGDMEYFELIAFEPGTVPASFFNIYNGNTVTGTPIYSQSYPEIVVTQAEDPITFHITGTVPLIVSNQYTFEFIYSNVPLLYEFNGTYGGGNLWAAGTSYPDQDFLFSISILNSLGINNNDPPASIKLFPNPSNNFISISGLKDKEEYNIYSVTGKKILSGSIFNNDKIDIQMLTHGLYFLNFENGNTLKFIKE